MDTKKEYYDSIIFEGGGVLGFSYAGSIKILEEKDLLKNIKRFAGTSVGSLFATLLCIGFTANEILKISRTINISQQSSCLCTKAFKIWKSFGIYSTNSLEQTFKNIIKKKVDPDITLKKLFEITNKDLVIVATNLSRQTAVYFHHVWYPDVKLIDALICSITVPGIFYPKKVMCSGTEDYFVDGRLSNNYPIWVFNDIEKLNNGKINDIDPESEIPKTTLGLKLLGYSEKNDRHVYRGRVDINNIQTFISSFVNTLMLQIEKADITPSYIKQTVPIIVPSGISFIDFSISKQNIGLLIESGKIAMKKYLK